VICKALGFSLDEECPVLFLLRKNIWQGGKKIALYMFFRYDEIKKNRKEERGMLMNWWNISVFCIIPIVSVVFFFFWKRKYLWMAPLISVVISVVISLLAMPSILSDAEHRNMFFGISIMLHILIVVVLTVIAYAAARFLAKK